MKLQLGAEFVTSVPGIEERLISKESLFSLMKQVLSLRRIFLSQCRVNGSNGSQFSRARRMSVPIVIALLVARISRDERKRILVPQQRENWRKRNFRRCPGPRFRT